LHSNSIYGKFKSGTDIRGVASEGVEGQHVNLTDEVCRAIVSGFLLWLSEKTGKSPASLRLAVGHDSRISAKRIKAAAIHSITEAGASVLDSGLSSTPSMFMITLDEKLDGAIQITASHHPYNRNGLKFFTPEGGLEGEDISDILSRCDRGETPPAVGGGECVPINYMDKYSERLRELIKREVNAADYHKPLSGFKIAVDAGNGAGGFYAGKVLSPLGADVSGSYFLEPDGMFPNHIPNPEDKEAMAAITRAVISSESDLGVIFDTDVDRAGAVDRTGEEINRNRLIALSAAIVLEDNKGATIVTDSTTSAGLKEFIEGTLGGKHYRYRRGYRNVINKAIELNKAGEDCPLAIETSGHAALRENYFLDDGAYLVTKIIITFAKLRQEGEGKTLDSLTSSLPVPLEEMELRIPIAAENFGEYGGEVLRELERYAGTQDGWIIADDNREGIRVTVGENGWFLLRLSVHDPIMPLNLESEREGGCKLLAAALMNAIKSFDKLKLTAVEEFLN
jgi:phosphomannomutase